MLVIIYSYLYTLSFNYPTEYRILQFMMIKYIITKLSSLNFSIAQMWYENIDGNS